MPTNVYVRPGRPTDEPGNYTWRDRRIIRQRTDLVKHLLSNPEQVLEMSRQHMSTGRYRPELIDFWGPMILNNDVEGLIHYHCDDLPIDWYHGHPVVWPGKTG